VDVERGVVPKGMKVDVDFLIVFNIIIVLSKAWKVSKLVSCKLEKRIVKVMFFNL